MKIDETECRAIVHAKKALRCKLLSQSLAKELRMFLIAGYTYANNELCTTKISTTRPANNCPSMMEDGGESAFVPLVPGGRPRATDEVAARDVDVMTIVPSVMMNVCKVGEGVMTGMADALIEGPFNNGE